jgi:hypothetical protein
MADNPTSEPLPASIEVGAPAAPAAPLTYDAAVARKAELFSQPNWASRYLNGDAEARREFGEITQALTLGAPDPARTARELGAAGLRGFLKAHHVDEYVNQESVTAEIHEEAVEMRKSLMRDKQFVAQYLDGDRAARQKMSLLAIVLNLPVSK